MNLKTLLTKIKKAREDAKEPLKKEKEDYEKEVARKLREGNNS